MCQYYDNERRPGPYEDPTTSCHDRTHHTNATLLYIKIPCDKTR